MPTMEAKKIAIVAGATGLIGSHLVKFLLDNPAYHQVVTIGRSNIDVTHDKLKLIKFDFSDSSSYDQLPQPEVIFCCLGTTIKKAGSQEKFKLIDLVYPLDLAKWGKAKGAKGYHVVTALGSDANSGIFYNKVKGELQNELVKLDYPGLCIYQPSLLTGDRKESRMGEKIGEVLMTLARPLMIGSLYKYRSIKGNTVANAMNLQSCKTNTGVNIIESDAIEDLGNNH